MRFLLLIFLSFPVFSQQFYRFKADVSIKDKLSDGTYRLTMGKVYYDKIYKKIVYQLKFPRQETIIAQDTTLYTLNKEGKLTATTRTVLVPEFTVFHLALTGRLADYGLKSVEEKPIYKIGKVEKTKTGVLTTWEPIDERFKKVFGNVQMHNVNKRLDAMIFFDKNTKIVSRQYFKKYTTQKGISFPQEVTMISYLDDGKENIQLTTYKNVVIDQTTEDEIYRYRIPVAKPVRK